MEWKENRKVIMTKDRKCIVRGKGQNSYILCTVDEQSRYKIKDMINPKLTIERFKKFLLPISDEVKKLYNTESCWYFEEVMGDLEEVKIECIMRTI